jgi:UDP-N-acetylglucosamine:LPS N-acetylglucosamine transferase
MILQSELTGERLAEEISNLINDRDKVAAMAAAAKKIAHPDAAAATVDIIEELKRNA